ncbi:HESO1-like protein [Drosera capensis]
MNTTTVLDLALREILYVVNPTKEDWDKRLQFIDEFRDVISTVESLRGATVEPFGSFLSNLFTRWGDLDISIDLTNGSYIASTGKKHKQALLREVMKALRKKGGLRWSQLVSNARVPVLKFERNYLSISCDVSISNLSGQMKSKSLLWISLMDSRFRDMVLLVKEWAKAQDINNPKAGSFNSYSLSLLIIFHFQTCDPAILPPLQELYPGNMADDLTGVRAEVTSQLEEIFVNNIGQFKYYRKPNHSSLTELFITFLEKIEDPFEQPENTARAVTSGQLTRITEVFKTTLARLMNPNANRPSIISTLVRAEISSFLLGTNNLSSPFERYPGPRGKMRKDMHSTQPFEYHVQKTRPGNHRTKATSWMPMHVSEKDEVAQDPDPVENGPRLSTKIGKTNLPKNVNKQRPVQTTQGRGQQMWRPKVPETSNT